MRITLIEKWGVYEKGSNKFIAKYSDKEKAMNRVKKLSTMKKMKDGIERRLVNHYVEEIK